MLGAFQKSGEKASARFLKAPWQFWTVESLVEQVDFTKTATDLTHHLTMCRVFPGKVKHIRDAVVKPHFTLQSSIVVDSVSVK